MLPWRRARRQAPGRRHQSGLPSLVGWKLVAVDVPIGAREPMFVPFRTCFQSIVKRTGRNDRLSTATSEMRKGRSALPAKCRGEAARSRQVVTRHKLLPLQPPQSFRSDEGVRRMCRPRCLTASRTVTLVKTLERQIHGKCDAAAQTASARNHESAPITTAPSRQYP
jgi:hypothetical protein